MTVFLVVADVMVGRDTIHCHDRVADVSPAYCALVLGTSKERSNGRPNRFFKHRIEAAAALYASGKCRKLIVSGDNGAADYNEPADMRAELIRLGVPAADIQCDYAGFRTLDSVVRFHEVFGQQRGIVVSQASHNARAIYIARSRGIELVGYNAEDVGAAAGAKNRLRECVARAACVLDVRVFGTAPKFLGPRIVL